MRSELWDLDECLPEVTWSTQEIDECLVRSCRFQGIFDESVGVKLRFASCTLVAFS